MALGEVGARDREGVEGDGGLVGLGGKVHLRGRVGEGQEEPAQDGGAPGGSSGLVVVAAGGQVSVEAAAQGVAMETPGGQLFQPQRVLALGSPFLKDGGRARAELKKPHRASTSSNRYKRPVFHYVPLKRSCAWCRSTHR